MKPITEWNIKANNNKWYNFKDMDKLTAVKKFKNKFPNLKAIFLEEVQPERINK